MSCNDPKLLQYVQNVAASAGEHARLQLAKAGASAGSASTLLFKVAVAPAVVFTFVLMFAAGPAVPRLFLNRSFLFQIFRDGKRKRRRKLSLYPCSTFSFPHSFIIIYHILTVRCSDATLFQGGQIHSISIKDMLPGGCHAASALNEGQQPDWACRPRSSCGPFHQIASDSLLASHLQVLLVPKPVRMWCWNRWNRWNATLGAYQRRPAAHDRCPAMAPYLEPW